MLKDILAISGQPGLYKLVSSTKNGIIVENIETGKRMPTYSTSKVSALQDIAIYTNEGEDNPLENIFKTIREKEKGGPAIDPKAENKQLKTYFESLMPNFDQDRVYVSDMKKVFQWYNILQKQNMLDILDQQPEPKTGSEEAEK